MGANFQSAGALALIVMHRIAYAAVILFTLAILTATLLSAIGYWPWLQIDVKAGDQTIANAGIYLQAGLTVMAVTLLFFLPGIQRILRLEDSHRAFSMGIEDVARAYHHAHAADRDDAFKLGPEFDAMRERLTWLRTHPDLGNLEPEILELAAQMSYISRDLAATYSNENINRAKAFLKQRQEEVERFNKRLDEANVLHQELKHWLTMVELEESVAAAQLERLRDELYVMMPDLGMEAIPRRDRQRRKVIDLHSAAE
ncbi:MAG: DNA repair protein [Paracoccaceae bacterium]